MIYFNKETSKFVSRGNAKIGFLPTQNQEDIYIYFIFLSCHVAKDHLLCRRLLLLLRENYVIK